LFVGADAESSVILRYGSSNESGIGTADEHNVCKWHRLRMLVIHSSADALCIRGYRHEAHYEYECNLSHHPSFLLRLTFLLV
jgi:phosphopantetheine adenylyltransferase